MSLGFLNLKNNEYFTIIKFFVLTLHGMYGMLRKEGVEFKLMSLFCLNIYFLMWITNKLNILSHISSDSVPQYI